VFQIPAGNRIDERSIDASNPFRLVRRRQHGASSRAVSERLQPQIFRVFTILRVIPAPRSELAAKRRARGTGDGFGRRIVPLPVTSAGRRIRIRRSSAASERTCVRDARPCGKRQVWRVPDASIHAHRSPTTWISRSPGGRICGSSGGDIRNAVTESSAGGRGGGRGDSAKTGIHQRHLEAGIVDVVAAGA